MTRAPDRERTFAAFYEAVHADLVRFVQRRTGPGAADDVVADALLVVWRRLDDLPPDDDAARAWVFGIARHLLLNAQRGERRRRALAVRLAEAPVTPDAADDVVSAVDLARAWRLLPAAHQEALALAAFEGLTAAQAAVVLGISPVAFRLRLSRARRALRLHLDHLPSVAPSPAVRPTDAATTLGRTVP